MKVVRLRSRTDGGGGGHKSTPICKGTGLDTAAAAKGICGHNPIRHRPSLAGLGVKCPSAGETVTITKRSVSPRSKVYRRMLTADVAERSVGAGGRDSLNQQLKGTLPKGV